MDREERGKEGREGKERREKIISDSKKYKILARKMSQFCVKTRLITE